MYKIKEGVDLKSLEKYGFKLGKEFPQYERWICNSPEYNDYWLIPMNPDEPGEPLYAEGDLLLWEIHIQSSRRIWIDCIPSCTYHIDNCDMEQMFYTIKCMIEDGILEDDYAAAR